ncbi:FAD-binding oxidoreductase [Yoonia sediminilitoris]|uniref:FAD/FMN-containing dehydrogenase n=1 Tax=Yoonia sediminilitoris TaxID=1286148 RepID=A0A2T6KK17_9RHOB|nr:FAD-binding oxidoreductase [Yoonia sediminilitoris]PUB16296.1 FAD/FMN-containing dehydrogenase [Yoonia sediminilitoris]RCW96645.1 FAD/FMN-containing dehydrogenase [Yoonia sediminilitoris]
MLSPVTPAFEAELRQILPATSFKEDTAPYLSEPRGRWAGQGFVVAPATVDEVAAVVKACAAEHVAIVPYSGGTGLVGGQLLQEGAKPVVLSLERMNRIRAVYPTENVLVCDAGVILADVQKAAEDVDRLFPLSLASEGSARVGGLLSTNAGGVNVLRYGNARALCLGLEVVRPDGTVWHGLTRLRKDNTGYDLRDLMIGAEGTLGIITGATLRLVPRPASIGAAMMAVPSPEAALQLLAMAGSHIGDGLSAFELIHRQGFDFLAEVGPDVRQPFTELPEWSVLIDVGLPKGLASQDALEGLFEAAFGAGLVTDGVIAQSLNQRQELWDIRENIPEANRRIGSISSHDISLPLSAVPDFIKRGGEAIAAIGAFRINCFGHLGDGNLHYNVFPMPGLSRADFMAERQLVKTALHDLAHGMGGSVSAEHGIGRLKVGDLERYGDPVKLAMLRAIKDALDPAGIMNPGAVLRQPA